MKNSTQTTACCIAVIASFFLAGSAAAAGGIKAIVTPLVGDAGYYYWAVPADKAPGDPAVVYLSADRGATWDASVPLPTQQSEPPSITHVGYSFDHLYVGTATEGVFRTADGRDWEKWNEADVGIVEMQSYSPAGWIGVITTDGATFSGIDTGFDISFTQYYDVPLTATALHMDNWGLLVGASDGHVYQPGGLVFQLTDGQGGRPGPLPGAVRAIVEEGDFRYFVVEDDTGRNRLYSKPSWSLPGPFKRLMLEGEPVYVHTVARAAGGLGIITSGNAQRLLYTCDNGESWTEIPLPVTGGVNSFDMSGCGNSGSHWPVRLATDEGGFESTDQGATWRAYGDIGSEDTGSVRVANSDIGIRMVSPTPDTAYVSNTRSRFELEVTNHGSERVEDILVALDFVTWRNGSTQGGSSFGTSLKIDGKDCSRDVDQLLFPYKIAQCELDALEPGASARIVWIHGLGSDAFSMRLEAEVTSDRLVDSNPGNDQLSYSPNVRDAGTAASYNDDSGGGGATGLWMLLALFATAAFRRNRLIKGSATFLSAKR